MRTARTSLPLLFSTPPPSTKHFRSLADTQTRKIRTLPGSQVKSGELAETPKPGAEPDPGRVIGPSRPRPRSSRSPHLPAGGERRPGSPGTAGRRSSPRRRSVSRTPRLPGSRRAAQARVGAGFGGTALRRADMSGVRAVSRLLRARRLALARAVSGPRGRAGAGRAGTEGPLGQGRGGRRVPAPRSVVRTVCGRPAGRSVGERGPPEGPGAVRGPAGLCPKPAGPRLCEGHDPVRLRGPRSPGLGSRHLNAGRRLVCPGHVGR